MFHTCPPPKKKRKKKIHRSGFQARVVYLVACLRKIPDGCNPSFLPSSDRKKLHLAATGTSSCAATNCLFANINNTFKLAKNIPLWQNWQYFRVKGFSKNDICDWIHFTFNWCVLRESKISCNKSAILLSKYKVSLLIQ